MISEAKYRKLKRNLEKLEKEREQRTGAVNQILRTLKEEFGCDTIEQAKKMIFRLKKEQKENEVKFDKAFTKFEKEYNRFVKQMAKGRK